MVLSWTCLLERFVVSVSITGICWQCTISLKLGSSPRPLVSSGFLLWITCQTSSRLCVFALRSLLLISVWHVAHHQVSFDDSHHSSTGDLHRARTKEPRVSYTGDNFASTSSVLTKWLFGEMLYRSGSDELILRAPPDCPLHIGGS